MVEVQFGKITPLGNGKCAVTTELLSHNLRFNSFEVRVDDQGQPEKNREAARAILRSFAEDLLTALR